jgi:hypothetical protein
MNINGGCKMLEFNPKKDNMHAVSAIVDILKMCGCNPIVKTTDNGNAIIRVNAPLLKEEQNNDN